MADRTPAEREAARFERERRRAEREGRTPPPAPAPSPPDARRVQVPGGPIPSTHPPDPQPTQQFDVTAEWTEEHATIAVEDPAPDPEPDPDPEVPLGTRRVTAKEHPRFGGRTRRPAKPADTTRSPRRMPRRTLLLVAIVLIAGAAWFLSNLYQPFKGDPGARVAVKVPNGATVGQIGDLLQRDGVIDSSFYFGLRAAIAGQRGDLKSGTFTLRKDMSYGDALTALTHNPPPPPVVRVTIPEGLSRREAAPIVKQDGIAGDYLAATRTSKALNPHRYGAPKGTGLEGFLFPATYELRRHATAQQLVAEQLAAFKQNLAGVNLRYARSKNLTAYDVVVIASMVEREVAVAKERPLVAAVIYNRLHQGIPLGIDATLRFALHDWTHPLTVSELASTTPYNTRNHQGLPPGPIGNPGLASIEAAAHPAHVGYLFYVVKPGTCGRHAFSSTDAQFQRDVARYNAARDAAGGKSPTKC
ncbi:MAG TPA: endolytic transglycosylase MltG [Conexibacter sp.]|nr:endolytic transglycosylase MltG [Conexibacter sp.]